MRIFFLFLTVVFLSSSLFSQTRLSELIKQFDIHMSDKNMDSAIHVSSQLFQFGDSLLIKKRMSDAFICFVNVDNCLQRIRKETSDFNDIVCNILNEMAWRYRFEDKYDLSLNMLERSAKIRKSSSYKDTLGLYQTYNRLRIIYDVLFKFEIANNYSDTANSCIESIYNFRERHPVQLAQNYQNDVVRYLHLNNHKKAYQLLNKSKSILEYIDQNGEFKDQETRNKKLSNHYNVWAWYYTKCDSSFYLIKKAYSKSIFLMKKAGGNYAGRMNMFAKAHKERGLFNSADSLLNLSIQYFDSVKKSSLRVNRLDAILTKADLYVEMGKIDIAEELYKNIDTLKMIYGHRHPEFISKQNALAKLHLRKGQGSKALKIFLKNFDLTRKRIANNFQWLSDKDKEQYWKQESEFFEDIFMFAEKVHHELPQAVSLSYNAALLIKSKLLETTIKEENYWRDAFTLREEIEDKEKSGQPSGRWFL